MEELKTTGEAVQYIVIKLGNEQYGINIKYVDNILRMQHITRVPKVESYLKGVINLRGEVVPVMSIRTKMGLEADVETKSSRIIIIKMEQHGYIGIIVDEVKEVVTLEMDQIEKVAYDAKDDKSNFISGVGKCENGLISLLDLSLIVPENS
ncbi:MAG: chemotaxis protein CheW [Clostridiales bacterium]|nr:chemotaxis protein CheW [Clostridiales bacterium]